MSPENLQSHSSRLAAARIVERWLSSGDFPDRLVSAAETHDRPFVMEVVYGIVRRRRLLDWVIGRLAPREPDAALRPFLLVGLYQALLLEDVTDYAAVNETVDAVKAGGMSRAAGFLNAVLRRALREKKTLLDEITGLPTAVRESHPDILVERWTNRFGEAATLELCCWNNSRPSVAVRPNLLRTTVDDFRAALAKAGIAAEPHRFSPYDFLVLPRGVKVPDVPGYAVGLFAVHDPSTMAAVDLLDPHPGGSILDACAAPGGKTAMIAQRMAGHGRLVSMDLYEDRLALLRKNVARMRLPGVEIVKGDANDRQVLEELAPDGFDGILLDVPCTNTGVLRRRPDARWRFSLERLKALEKKQHSMLKNVSRHLKVGGRLVYSTCSLEYEEGEGMIKRRFRDYRDMALTREVTLFPPNSGTDGIYAACLTRLD